MASGYERLRDRLSGASALLTTPFDDAGAVDEAALREKVRFQMASGFVEGTGALVVLGSVGECNTLSAAEQRRVVEAAVEAADGRVPVVAGANHTGTRVAADLAERALDAGADAVMVVTPYYYPPGPESVQRHYEGVADAVDGGIVLYNNFVVSGIDVPASVVGALARQPQFVAIKEPTLDQAKLERVVAAAGDGMAVLNGNGLAFEPQGALAGTDGFHSTWADFAPGLALAVHRLARAGRYEDLRALKRRHVAPLADAFAEIEAERGPAALKYLADRLGVPGGGPVRSPHPELAAAERERFDRALDRAALSELE